MARGSQQLMQGGTPHAGTFCCCLTILKLIIILALAAELSYTVKIVAVGPANTTPGKRMILFTTFSHPSQTIYNNDEQHTRLTMLYEISSILSSKGLDYYANLVMVQSILSVSDYLHLPEESLPWRLFPSSSKIYKKYSEHYKRMRTDSVAIAAALVNMSSN
jgi:hypothetical protein